MKINKLLNDTNSKELLIPQARKFLTELYPLYPGIDKWWDSKVIPGIDSGERVCFVATEDNLITGIAIGKHSNNSAKLCSLRVRYEMQGLGIGKTIITATLKELTKTCDKVHLTATDKIVALHGYFFKKYGFKEVVWHNGLYVNGSDEIVFEAKTTDINEVIDYGK